MELRSEMQIRVVTKSGTVHDSNVVERAEMLAEMGGTVDAVKSMLQRMLTVTKEGLDNMTLYTGNGIIVINGDSIESVTYFGIEEWGVEI